MDGQSAVLSGLFVKALIIAVGAATGILGIVVAFSLAAGLVRLIGAGVSKLGSMRKSKSKDDGPQPVPMPNHP